MTLDRRSFLRRSSIALAGGLVLGDEVLEAFERLTHRPVFALGGLPETATGILERRLSYNIYMNRQMAIVTERISADLYRQSVPNEMVLLGRVEVKWPDGLADKFVTPDDPAWTTTQRFVNPEDVRRVCQS